MADRSHVICYFIRFRQAIYRQLENIAFTSNVTLRCTLQPNSGDVTNVHVT